MTPSTSLAEIVANHPSTAATLEGYALDFCCNGRQTLAESCQAKGLDVTEVLAELETAAAVQAPSEEPPIDDAAAQLAYILNNHHVFVKTNLPLISDHLGKVVRAHGGNHPELAQVGAQWQALHDELASHLMKEEQILFPYIQGMLAAKAGGPLPESCFGTVQSPIHVMEAEHEDAGAAVANIRQLTKDYAVPADACPTYQLVLKELEAFELDLHRHVHRENYLLHPLALELEAELKQAG